MPRQIILASASPYRRQMLERINLPFTTAAADLDETPHPGESAATLVARLAAAKARAVAADHPNALIIGADQIADHRGNLIGKPADHQAATRQLLAMSGERITLMTGVALYDAATEQMQCEVDAFHVEFRPLTKPLVERYLRTEKPYHCCGSLKAEGLGIVLLNRLQGDDPNSLIGLPLIRLISMLQTAGVHLL